MIIRHNPYRGYVITRHRMGNRVWLTVAKEIEEEYWDTAVPMASFLCVADAWDWIDNLEDGSPPSGPRHACVFTSVISNHRVSPMQKLKLLRHTGQAMERLLAAYQ